MPDHSRLIYTFHLAREYVELGQYVDGLQEGTTEAVHVRFRGTGSHAYGILDLASGRWTPCFLHVDSCFQNP